MTIIGLIAGDGIYGEVVAAAARQGITLPATDKNIALDMGETIAHVDAAVAALDHPVKDPVEWALLLLGVVVEMASSQGMTKGDRIVWVAIPKHAQDPERSIVFATLWDLAFRMDIVAVTLDGLSQDFRNAA